jgi:hypothetical protein
MACDLGELPPWEPVSAPRAAGVAPEIRRAGESWCRLRRRLPAIASERWQDLAAAVKSLRQPPRRREPQ